MDRAQTHLERVLDVLRAFQPASHEAGIDLVGVVGSIARGEAGPESDVDIVFDARENLDYWRLGGLQMDLQDALARRVDLIDRALMPPARWTFMADDLVKL